MLILSPVVPFRFRGELPLRSPFEIRPLRPWSGEKALSDLHHRLRYRHRVPTGYEPNLADYKGKIVEPGYLHEETKDEAERAAGSIGLGGHA